jgi:uncharacterized protein YfaA (DUF2138 family)
LQRRTKLALGGAAGALVLGGALWAGLSWARYDGPINALHVDLSAPDGYVSTPALSRLPRDLVQAPLARELLTEDFAFYYEQHEERLALAGTIKRIAFEHDTTLADKLLALVLDEPAEVALWTDAKGAPRYWMVAMTRGALAKIAQDAAPLLGHDTQLAAIGDLPGAPGATKVFSLTLSARRTYAVVARGNRVVVLSDPGLLFDAKHEADPAAAKIVAALLSGDEKDQGVLRRHFGLEAPSQQHVLVADSSLLSFGYRHFFPGLRALRLDVAPGGAALKTQLRVADGTLPAPATADALWAGLPMGPAACTWLPADWTQARALLAEVPDPGATPTPAKATARDDAAAGLPAEAASAGGEPVDGGGGRKPQAKAASRPAAERPAVVQDKASRALWDRLAAGFDGPAAVCWYARSQLHTPVLVARLKPGFAPADADAALARLADWLVPGGAVPLPDDGHGRRWQREVPAPWGFYGDGDASTYRPTLAHAGPWVVFSPDDALVDLALATQARRYPSVADTLPAAGATLAVLEPRPLADLLDAEMSAVMPAREELLRQAADAQLGPRLATLRGWPAVRAVAAGKPSAQGWVALDWQPLLERRGPAHAEAPADGAPRAAGGRRASSPAGSR